MDDDDETLLELVGDIDAILHGICEEYGIDALALCAAVIARMHYFTMGYDCNADFKTLLKHASETEFHKKDKPNIRLVVNNDKTDG